MVWVNAGEVEFKVDSVLLQGKMVYKLTSSGRSYESYDWIFKVRESYLAYAECNPMRPISYIRKATEGGYSATEIYQFHHSAKKVYTSVETSEKSSQKDTLTINGCTYDLLTAIYYCRNLKFGSFNTGDKIPVSVLLDNKIENLYIRYLGKEYLRYKGKAVACIKFSVLLVEGTIFNEGENMTVWITDDEKRIPLYVEANILVGKVKAFLN